MSWFKKLPWKRIIGILAGIVLYMAPSPEFQALPKGATLVIQQVAAALDNDPRT